MIIRKAKTTELQQCIELLQDAFNGYAFFEIYVDDVKRRKKFFLSMMKIWMKNSFRYGTVLVCEDNEKIISVAVLKASQDKEIDFFDFSLQSLYSVLLGGFQATKAFRHMCEVSDKACHSLPDPKWHLVLLAVSSHSKGQGIGSKMLHDCILPYIAENGGGLLTFNTNAEINRAFYKKNGFEEFDVDTLNENGKEIGNWSYKRMIDACR